MDSSENTKLFGYLNASGDIIINSFNRHVTVCFKFPFDKGFLNVETSQFLQKS